MKPETTEELRTRAAIQTPLGPMEATFDPSGALTAFGFGLSNPEIPTHAELQKQIDEYFAGKRQRFDILLAPAGTDFQQRVWQLLQHIPYGQTRSYLYIAESMGRPSATRAVGMANHVNPIAIIVPCHRVIGISGKLTGYAGGLHIKRKLLELEGALTPTLF